MKYLVLYICSLPLALGAQTPQASEKYEASWEQSRYWEEIQDADGRFQLLSPQQFEYAVDTLATEIGEQILHTYHFATPDPARSENVIYALTYVDYPAGAIHHDSTELVGELLTSTEEEAVKALRGILIYGSEKRVSTYPARQWRIDYKDGDATARTLAVVAGNRYYELKVFSLKAAGPNKSANKFFDSFRLFAPPG